MMSRKPLQALCHNVTTFTSDGEFDEDAYRQSVNRLVESRIGISAASGGSGESHALNVDELRRVYRASVEEAKGKVPVESNQPEQHTAKLTIEHARIAIEEGVDSVGLYGPSGLHGYRADDEEFAHFFDVVLAEIKHPVMLNANPMMAGAKPATIAAIANKHPQVVAFTNSGQTGDGYFIALQDALERDIEIYVGIQGSMNTFAMGAAGNMVGIGNIVPKTVRRYQDAWDAGDLAAASAAYRDLRRFEDYTKQWKAAWPRAYKMSMRIFKLPGSTLHEPYLPASDAELEKFQRGLLALDIPEINQLARAAGVS
jgi:4-hydroxy-tetrahydrodipicolinate synthase